MRIDFTELKNNAAGKWDSIIPSLDGRFADIEAGGNAVPCPVHGGSDGFRLFRDFALTGGGVCNTCGAFPDGLSLLQWAAGEVNVRQAALRVNALLGTGDIQSAPQSNKPPKKRDTSKIKAASTKQWAAANDPVNAYARMYFDNRGLAPVEQYPAIRYADGTPYFDGGRALVGADGRWILWPAILCKMTDSKGCAGLLQVYLNNQGYRAGVDIRKAGASNDIDKKFLSHRSLVGSAVRIGDVGEDLAICEGVETGFAVRQLTGHPVAMCGTASLMMNVEIPPQVKRVHIFADHDRNWTGEKSAKVLSDALAADYEVKTYLPDMEIPAESKGVDWLDYLNKYQNGSNIRAVQG